MPLAENHPAKIRNGGDKAKLISSNDTSGFTFRGRFAAAEEVCGVGLEVTQKAHNALRWLIARQGYRDKTQAIVAWAVSGAEVPDPLSDTMDLLSGEESSATVSQAGYTAQEVAEKLKKLIKGYSVKLGPTDKVMIMALDSATPGRMAVSYYRELTGSDFLERILAWHTGCSWLQKFRKDKVFIGAPAPRDISECAYGGRLSDNLRRATIERLLPCIIDGMNIPRDLVESCIYRASNRTGHGDYWQWEKTLGIACALYRRYVFERRHKLALERDRQTRDYLYGRLLALAEHLERRALNLAGERRETNAGKLMQRFTDRPYSTWLTIETSLTPSKIRLRTNRPGFLLRIEKEIDQVMSSFEHEEFLADHRLTGEFLLGYHCQRSALWPDSSKASDNDERGQDEDQESA
jgi:CRISPR-associated protein Csd1